MTWMFKTVLFSLIEDMIRGLSGSLGIRLRRAWYRRRFKKCGRGLVIESAVSIVGAKHISLGDDVWIDRSVVLIAGPPRENLRIDIRREVQGINHGDLIIGNGAHIGIGSILQAHGGITIGDGFTTSPHVKIYSMSNDYRKCREGTVIGDPGCILASVEIGNNVWIGIQSIVIGHTIGNDTFVRPSAIVVKDLPANSVAEGNPARLIGQRFEQSAKVDTAV